MFDVLIIGGGVSSVSCALVLGSAKNKAFASAKKIGIITHQKNSALQEAVINNAYGIPAGKLGADLLLESLQHLSELYPHIEQFSKEKVLRIDGFFPEFSIVTNKNTYKSKSIIIGIGSANTFAIDSLMNYLEPHKKSIPEKQRIQLKNSDHKVAEGIYVSGTLAGCRSQVAIVAGSGASVATDILSLWNDGVPTQIHDSTR